MVRKYLKDKKKLQPAGRAAKAPAKKRAFKLKHAAQYHGLRCGKARMAARRYVGGVRH